ncbi:phage tail family protein [Staphylococcus aureus]|nr:phage tail family protein [Staphylococcus aureus]
MLLTTNSTCIKDNNYLGEDTESFVWNLTHAEIMKIEGIKLKAGDRIVYDSFRVYKNGVEISTETNIAQPKFKYGANKFEFNQTVQKVQFDLKFIISRCQNDNNY